MTALEARAGEGLDEALGSGTLAEPSRMRSPPRWSTPPERRGDNYPVAALGDVIVVWSHPCGWDPWRCRLGSRPEVEADLGSPTRWRSNCLWCCAFPIRPPDLQCMEKVTVAHRTHGDVRLRRTRFRRGVICESASDSQSPVSFCVPGR